MKRGVSHVRLGPRLGNDTAGNCSRLLVLYNRNLSKVEIFDQSWKVVESAVDVLLRSTY